MRIDLPTFTDALDLDRVDAFLRRDGALLPLRLAFDPRDFGAEARPAPTDAAEAERMRRMAEDVERIAAAHRLIAPIAEIVDRMTPIAETIARVEAAETAIRNGRRHPADARIAADLAGLESVLRQARAFDARTFVFGKLAEGFEASLARDEDEINQTKLYDTHQTEDHKS